MAGSILQQLLALYFTIIYSWQLSSSEKSIMGKKFIHMPQGFYRFRFLFLFFFFFHSFSFSLTNPAYLVGYTKIMLYSQQPTVVLARRHLNTILLTNFENSKFHFWTFSKKHIILVLAEPVIICIYLRTADRHFGGQVNVCHLASKLLKCDLIQIKNIFGNPPLQIFAGGKASLVETIKS